jgi:hypothetical protein
MTVSFQMNLVIYESDVLSILFLWKAADPGIAEVEVARERLGGLQEN